MEPLCSPDNNMGPDLLSLMWNSSYTKYCSLLAQTKFEISTGQENALITLVPKWFWMQKRNTSGETSTFTNQEMLKRCDTAKERIAPKDKPCVWLLIEFPTTCEGDSKFECCHRDSIFPCKDKDCMCPLPYDFLHTVDGVACKDLFDTETHQHMISTKSNASVKQQTHPNKKARRRRHVKKC
eukprot:scaffold114402_cov58-Attheya_sp.AAC.4